jgi:hypothetical protein
MLLLPLSSASLGRGVRFRRETVAVHVSPLLPGFFSIPSPLTTSGTARVWGLAPTAEFFKPPLLPNARLPVGATSPRLMPLQRAERATLKAPLMDSVRHGLQFALRLRTYPLCNTAPIGISATARSRRYRRVSFMRLAQIADVPRDSLKLVFANPLLVIEHLALVDLALSLTTFCQKRL